MSTNTARPFSFTFTANVDGTEAGWKQQESVVQHTLDVLNRMEPRRPDGTERVWSAKNFRATDDGRPALVTEYIATPLPPRPPVT